MQPDKLPEGIKQNIKKCENVKSLQLGIISITDNVLSQIVRFSGGAKQIFRGALYINLLNDNAIFNLFTLTSH